MPQVTGVASNPAADGDDVALSNILIFHIRVGVFNPASFLFKILTAEAKGS